MPAAYALGNLQHALTFGVIDIGTVIIHPFVFTFILSTFYMPDTVLSVGDKCTKQTRKQVVSLPS